VWLQSRVSRQGLRPLADVRPAVLEPVRESTMSSGRAQPPQRCDFTDFLVRLGADGSYDAHFSACTVFNCGQILWTSGALAAVNACARDPLQKDRPDLRHGVVSPAPSAGVATPPRRGDPERSGPEIKSPPRGVGPEGDWRREHSPFCTQISLFRFWLLALGAENPLLDRVRPLSGRRWRCGGGRRVGQHHRDRCPCRGR